MGGLEECRERPVILHGCNDRTRSSTAEAMEDHCAERVCRTPDRPVGGRPAGGLEERVAFFMAAKAVLAVPPVSSLQPESLLDCSVSVTVTVTPCPVRVGFRLAEMDIRGGVRGQKSGENDTLRWAGGFSGPFPGRFGRSCGRFVPAFGRVVRRTRGRRVARGLRNEPNLAEVPA